jgi:RecA-family ATPase
LTDLKQAQAAVDRGRRMRPAIVDVATIMSRQLAPVRYIIPGWLSEGLTLLVANPKVGKSTLVLQLAHALASGGEFWGEIIEPARVLMIDLETNERRLRRKLDAAGGSPIPSGSMKFAFDWPRGVYGVEEIARVLDEDPAIRLVVIDTLQRFRELSAGGKNAYAADYDALTPLHQLCKERPGLAIVVVHHRRKARADDDPIDSINGSAALAGAADGIWLLGRRGADYTLQVRARDWERDEDDFVLRRQDGRWELDQSPRYSYTERELLSLLDKLGPLATAQIAEGLNPPISRQAALKRAQLMQSKGLLGFTDGAWRSLV